MGKKLIKPTTFTADYDLEPGETWFLDSQTARVDNGNGVYTAYRPYFDSKDNLKFSRVSIPNVRVSVKGKRLSDNAYMGAMAEVEYTTVEFMGKRYAIGDEALYQAGGRHETFANNESRYESDQAIMLTLSALALSGMPSGDVKLILSVPPELIDIVGKRMRDAYQAGEHGHNDGEWSLTLDGKAYTYHIKRLKVMMECQVAYGAYAFDANGNRVVIPHRDTGVDVLSGLVGQVDSGYGTLDRMVIVEGQIDTETIQTDDSAGILDVIIRPTLEDVRRYLADNDIRNLRVTEAMVDWYFKRWIEGDKQEDFSVNLGNYAVPIGRFFRTHTRTLFDIQVNAITQMLRVSDTCLLMGGGFYATLDDIKIWADGGALGKRTVLYPDRKSTPHLAKVPINELNAYGGLVSLAATLNWKHSRRNA